MEKLTNNSNLLKEITIKTKNINQLQKILSSVTSAQINLQIFSAASIWFTYAILYALKTMKNYLSPTKAKNNVKQKV